MDEEPCLVPVDPGVRRAARQDRASSVETVHRLAEVIDRHRWDDLPSLLHPGFSCRYVHTGEMFDRDAWVRLNADYPGFQRFTLQDCVSSGDRAAARSHVTAMSDGQVQHFEVASFITVREGVVVEMTEVWTDVEQDSPEGERPR